MPDEGVLFPGRFTELAEIYRDGRPTYPKQLARRVVAHVGLTPTDQVLDLGTGPGFLAFDFAPYAACVIAALRDAVRTELARRPLHIDAWVVLPDHMHCQWTFPEGDADFSGRMREIKAGFTRRIARQAEWTIGSLRPIWITSISTR